MKKAVGIIISVAAMAVVSAIIYIAVRNRKKDHTDFAEDNVDINDEAKTSEKKYRDSQEELENTVYANTNEMKERHAAAAEYIRSRVLSEDDVHEEAEKTDDDIIITTDNDFDDDLSHSESDNVENRKAIMDELDDLLK